MENFLNPGRSNNFSGLYGERDRTSKALFTALFNHGVRPFSELPSPASVTLRAGPRAAARRRRAHSVTGCHLQVVTSAVCYSTVRCVTLTGCD
eukprot:470132-Hanusia_phi.AAC.1